MFPARCTSPVCFYGQIEEPHKMWNIPSDCTTAYRIMHHQRISMGSYFTEASCFTGLSSGINITCVLSTDCCISRSTNCGALNGALKMNSLLSPWDFNGTAIPCVQVHSQWCTSYFTGYLYLSQKSTRNVYLAGNISYWLLPNWHLDN